MSYDMYNREANNNNNSSSKNINKEPQQRIVKPTFQLTPPCGRKFGTTTMNNNNNNNGGSNNHSSIAGTLLSAAATTSAFQLENNNNNVKPMTPPAQRKLGTSSPVPQAQAQTQAATLPSNDPRLSYPFCPYKAEGDEERHSSGRTASLSITCLRPTL
jgi:hypothetical protein